MYLVALGLLQLARCDITGLLLLWLSGGLREYRNAFRIATLIYLGLYVLLGVVGTLISAVQGPTNSLLRITGYYSWHGPPAWAPYLFGALWVLVFGLPLYWLAAPGTREAFRQRAKGKVVLCRNCQYNLLGIDGDACPECGAPIPFRQTDANDD
jgi:hypothetical protein